MAHPLASTVDPDPRASAEATGAGSIQCLSTFADCDEHDLMASEEAIRSGSALSSIVNSNKNIDMSSDWLAVRESRWLIDVFSRTGVNIQA